MTSSANGDGAEGFPAIVGPVGEQNLLHPDFSLGKSKRVQVQTNVNYIAAGIVLRGDGDNLEVCLVQEAKEDCYGLWYMPAGRIERGESLSDGVKREILEESGLEVTVDDLTSVEVQGGGWYRFTFCCTATGGSLKTTADKESLSAQWFSVSDVIQRKMKLRSKDMLTVVNNAVDYHRQRNSEQAILRPRISVIEENVAGMYLRLLIMRRKNGRMELLASKDTVGVGHDSLPLVEFPLNCYVAAAISKFYRRGDVIPLRRPLPVHFAA
uniref:Nudix hydrolase domain-containing protein n=1 Tax=Plectus sambesii TaxID=2011161 RepID=A0A914UK09_9BILA